MELKDGFKTLETDKNFRAAEKFVCDAIQRENYPSNHPFLEYKSYTPDGLAVVNIILLKLFGVEDSAIVSLVKKCKSVEDGKFNYTRYRQNINEVVFLCYIMTGLFLKGQNIPYINYEDPNIIENSKVTEYSFLMNDILVNVEVKTLNCDAFPYDVAKDGDQYILPYYIDESFWNDLKNQFPYATILGDKCCLNQLKRNILKIKHKFDGRNMTPHKLFNIGVIFIDYSTSFEQFFSYFFNKKFGLMGKINFGNIDGLILISLDAKVEMFYTNIYDMGYVQTLLFNDDPTFVEICKTLRLDCFMLKGDVSYEDILNKAQNEFEVLKVLKRNGFMNLIPYDTPENEINEYINFLNGNTPRKTTSQNYFSPEIKVFGKDDDV